MDTKLVHYQPRVLLRGYQLSVGVLKIIFLLLSLLQTSQNFIKIQVYPRLKGEQVHSFLNNYIQFPAPDTSS